MEIDEITKKAWQTPEVIDLDINNDTTKISAPGESTLGAMGPS